MHSVPSALKLPDERVELTTTPLVRKQSQICLIASVLVAVDQTFVPVHLADLLGNG
jgi:hypothetical protein